MQGIAFDPVSPTQTRHAPALSYRALAKVQAVAAASASLRAETPVAVTLTLTEASKGFNRPCSFCELQGARAAGAATKLPESDLRLIGGTRICV